MNENRRRTVRSRTGRNVDPESELDRGLLHSISTFLLVKDGAAAAMSVAAASAAAAAEKPVSNETADGCGGRQMALKPECRPGSLY